MQKFRYFILALVCCMLVSAPISTMAAEGKISYLEEIQSVSAGDVRPYALMALNEDYGVAGASTTYPKTFYDFSKTVYYSPSFYTTGDVLSIQLFTSSLTMDYNENYIQLHLPITISGTTVGDNFTRYEAWIIYGGKKYVLGSGDWYEVKLDDNFGWHSYIQVGVDLYFSSNYVHSYEYNNLPISGKITGDSRTDDLTDEVRITTYDQVVDLKVDYLYMSKILNNRPNFHPITISMTGGSYLTGHYEREEIGLLNSIISNIQSYGQSIIDNVTTFKNELFTKLDDIFSTDNTVISGAMDDYQSAEQEVFAPAMDSLTDFDFGSNDISSLGTGFIGAITFVSSCLSNMYDLTPFSAVFDVIATLGLASICIGISRLWFGKKGR